MRLTEAMIREKAYELWEANGRPMDAAERHWYTAETLLSEAIEITLGGKDKNGKHLPPIGLRKLSHP